MIKKTAITLVVLITVGLVLGATTANRRTLEERVAELEGKVAFLEARVLIEKSSDRPSDFIEEDFLNILEITTAFESTSTLKGDSDMGKSEKYLAFKRSMYKNFARKAKMCNPDDGILYNALQSDKVYAYLIQHQKKMITKRLKSAADRNWEKCLQIEDEDMSFYDDLVKSYTEIVEAIEKTEGSDDVRDANDDGT